MQHPVIDLVAVARRVMVDHGLFPDFEAAVQAELLTLPSHDEVAASPEMRDLRSQLWSSIDNVESRDLDQIEVAERQGERIRVRVGIADVDRLAHLGSALDRHAGHNTTSVYTGAVIFPMLPEKLSTDMTSLNFGVDRMAIVVEYDVEPDGSLGASSAYRALVHNRARLNYNDVAAFLGGAPTPSVDEIPGLAEQLRLQDEAAQRLRKRRHERGALELESVEAHAVSKHGEIVALEVTAKNRARDLIEDFMVAANATMAGFLDHAGFASIRRVVKEPERWKRIVALAATLGEALPETASSIALSEFLAKRRAADPTRFADLSLAVVKLMGPGMYAVEKPGQAHTGHFGLAVQDYTQSTAPNRRYADLITQRLLKACVAKQPAPYSDDELAAIAAQCMVGAAAAQKVERMLRKVAAALFLAPRAGETFAAVVTGVTTHGTFVRLLDPPAEGRVIQGERGMDVGDRVDVRLLRTEPLKGFIDFARG
jgi:exoribonuclease-2